MSAVTPAKCSDCGEPLTSQDVCCPVCGSGDRDIVLSDRGVGQDSIAMVVKEFYETNPGIHAVVIALSGVSVLVGALLQGIVGILFGVAISAILYVLSPPGVTKIRETRANRD